MTLTVKTTSDIWKMSTALSSPRFVTNIDVAIWQNENTVCCWQIRRFLSKLTSLFHILPKYKLSFQSFLINRNDDKNLYHISFWSFLTDPICMLIDKYQHLVWIFRKYCNFDILETRKLYLGVFKSSGSSNVDFVISQLPTSQTVCSVSV